MTTHAYSYALATLLLTATLGASDPTLLHKEAYQHLLLEEYSFGKAQCIQIEGLKQFNEHDSTGSSNSSCIYHVARNGQLIAQCSLFPEDTTSCFEQLVDVEHMASKLRPPMGNYDTESSGELSPSTSSDELSDEAFSSPTSMREFIADEICRKNSNKPHILSRDFSDPKNTDSPDTEYAQNLLDFIKDEGSLGEHSATNAPLYYTVFENEYGFSLQKNAQEFTNRCILENARAIKEKLDKGEKVVGIVAIHNNSHKISPRTSPRGEGTDLYNGAIENNGHYILVCVISDGEKHQYILCDSASERNHFKRNPIVRDLIQYFESTDLANPVSLDAMHQTYSFGENSHIYNGFFSRLMGSPRKDRPEPREASIKRTIAYYAAAALCAYASYSYYASTTTEDLINHPPLVS